MGHPAIVWQGDIKTAFDSAPHWAIEEALQYMGLSQILVAAVMREYRQLWLQAEVGDSGLTEPARFEKGGRQGGVETPRMFNNVLRMIFDRIVQSWAEQGYGIAVGSAT